MLKVGVVVDGLSDPNTESRSFSAWQPQSSRQVLDPSYDIEFPLLVLHPNETVVERDEFGTFGVWVTLAGEDSSAFAALTARMNGRRLAFLVEDVVLLTPVVGHEIIAGPFLVRDLLSNDDASWLAERLSPN